MTSTSAKSSGSPSLIAVVGGTGSGKTHFVDVASGETRPTCPGLNPSNDKIYKTTQFNVSGRKICLIDTPGWQDGHDGKSIIDELESYLNGKKLDGIIYLQHIGDASHTPFGYRTWPGVQTLCKRETFKMVIAFTCIKGDLEDIQQQRAKFLNTTFAKQATRHCIPMKDFNDSKESADEVILEVLGTEGRQITRENPPKSSTGCLSSLRAL